MRGVHGRASLPLVVFLVACLSWTAIAEAGHFCRVTLRFFNHNRYVYDTDEECGGIHSSPWGNWGVSSNVGDKVDGHQFQGWYPSCTASKVEWNSCSVEYGKPYCARFNFPNPSIGYPLPANGYPFSDTYTHNDCASGAIPCTCVDQISPCGPNWYGSRLLSYSVASGFDLDCDGTYDEGGCMALDGTTLTVKGNFMTVYELDPWDTDDRVQSLLYPDLSVTLRCDPYSCWAAGDANHDWYVDDLHSRSSPGWVWPTQYIDEWGNARKRIDATIRIGYVGGSYDSQGACNPCDPSCSPPCDQWGCYP